ncbi:zinc-dependent peptidase [Photobacterium kasasachensis]|uniref:zinc-dependent peptidase n=1 Tax=Photobacterium kasasachensis TaxID=2910240 RepID=UPI003D0AD129
MFWGKSKKTKSRFQNVHDTLLSSMALYPFLSKEQQQIICHFVNEFYNGKTVLVSPDVKIEDRENLLVVIAANAALVGGAQQTDYFSCVKWIHICSDDLLVDGDAYETSTVRLNARPCLKESIEIIEGQNLVVHEFAHILDHMYGLSGSTSVIREAYEVYLGNIESQQEDLIPDCAAPPGEMVGHVYSHDEIMFYPPEEYFAVISELFFTNPVAIHNSYPELYHELVGIYGLNMAAILRRR